MKFYRGQRVRLTERGRRNGEWSGLDIAVGRVLANRERGGPVVRWCDPVTGATIVSVTGCPRGFVEPVD
jgi:hypothetical protein